MIYLDSAAATLRKPPSVERAMRRALRCGENAGRGECSSFAERVLVDCRREAAELFGTSPERIFFTSGATHALNIAVGALVGRGKRCVISGYEPSAVLRTLTAWGVETAVARSPLFQPEFFLFELERKLRRGADFAVLTHMSGVFGYVLPVERADELCASFGVPLIVDASQSAGTLPLDLSGLKAARFVCMPGHKGLYGPRGTGILIALGGDPADCLPQRPEAGVRNVHGIAGLLEGIRFVRRRTPEAILAHEKEVLRRILRGLDACPRIKTYAAPNLFCQGGVLSLELRGVDSREVAGRLAAEGIAVRGGLHCAPLAHDAAGTGQRGTVRVSPSAFTTLREADIFCEKISHLPL